MRATDFEIRNHHKLDQILAELCAMIVAGQRRDPDRYGVVAAAVLDPDNRLVMGINLPGAGKKRQHAERVAMQNYEREYGQIPQGSIILTTCSPCSEKMDDRDGVSCTELINNSPVRKVYCGFDDPTQIHSDQYRHKKFHTECTKNPKIHELCHMFASTFMAHEAEQLDELSFLGSPCTKDCSGHRAGYRWSKDRGNIHAASWSQSFNNGAALAAAGR
jgi:pyrimidine deaminase RibD-like protein